MTSNSGEHQPGSIISSPDAAPKPVYRRYIPELEIVRAFGVTIVILNHMWPWENSAHATFLWLQLAWILMDSFFVLSGFLITSILLDTRHRADYFKAFYIRRSLRIFPIYYAVLIFITAVAVFNGHAAYQTMRAEWGSPAWFFVYLGNIPTGLTGKGPLAGGGSYVPLWSLQVEEQFYLLFPLLIHRLKLKTLTRVLFTLCCISTLLRFAIYWRFPENELAQYVLLPCHMEGLAMGAWLAIRFRQGPWKINKNRLSAITFLGVSVAVASAAWGGYFHTTAFNRTFGFLISAIACTFAILWIIQFSGTPTISWLGNPVVRYMGKLSYSAYLFHWPVANILTAGATRLHAPAMDSGVVRLILIYALTFGLSALSWHYFERPIALLKDRLFPGSRMHRPI